MLWAILKPFLMMSAKRFSCDPHQRCNFAVLRRHCFLAVLEQAALELKPTKWSSRRHHRYSMSEEDYPFCSFEEAAGALCLVAPDVCACVTARSLRIVDQCRYPCSRLVSLG
jgi:hypothetical protein